MMARGSVSRRHLQGTGNRIRHIQIRTSAEIKRPEIRSYIRRPEKLL